MMPDAYITVSQAVDELERAYVQAQTNRAASIKLPPVSWAKVHAREEQKLRFIQEQQPLYREQARQRQQLRDLHRSASDSLLSYAAVRSSTTGEPRLSSNRLNSSSSTLFETVAPRPELTDNSYAATGSLSMLGSQVLSCRRSSGSFGFGTATREQLGRLYISPAHLGHLRCLEGAPPGSYEVSSSLGRQAPPRQLLSPPNA